MQTHLDTLSALKVALTVFASIVLNLLLFLYLIPGNRQSAWTFGAISGLTGAILHLLLKPRRPQSARIVTTSRGRRLPTLWHPQLAATSGHRK